MVRYERHRQEDFLYIFNFAVAFIGQISFENGFIEFLQHRASHKTKLNEKKKCKQTELRN